MQESNISSNHLIQVCAFDFNARNGKHKKKKKKQRSCYLLWQNDDGNVHSVDS